MAIVLVCSAIKSLIAPISRCTVSVGMALLAGSVGPVALLGVPTVGVLGAGERSAVGVWTSQQMSLIMDEG